MLASPKFVGEAHRLGILVGITVADLSLKRVWRQNSFLLGKAQSPAASERANGHAVLTRVNGDAGSRESANEVVIARTFGMVLPGCGCHGNASPFFIFLFPLPKLLIVIIWTVIKKDKERAM